MIFIITNNKNLYEVEIQYDNYGNIYLKDNDDYYRLEIIDNKPIFEYITNLERNNNNIYNKQINNYNFINQSLNDFYTLDYNKMEYQVLPYDDISYTKKNMVKKCNEELKQNPLYNTNFIINNNIVKKIFSKNNTATYDICIKNEGKIIIENNTYCYKKNSKNIEFYACI